MVSRSETRQEVNSFPCDPHLALIEYCCSNNQIELSHNHCAFLWHDLFQKWLKYQWSHYIINKVLCVLYIISEAIQYEMPSNPTRVHAFSFPTPACSHKFSSTVFIVSCELRFTPMISPSLISGGFQKPLDCDFC